MNENRTKFGTPSSPEIMNRYNSNALVSLLMSSYFIVLSNQNSEIPSFGVVLDFDSVTYTE